MIEVVCGVIRDAEGRYLACRRPLEKHLGGLWEFPGGKIEPGENPRQALARELVEELEIEVEIGTALGPVEWRYETITIRLLPFLCEIFSGEPRPVEHSELRWCHAAEFHFLAWAPADLPILDEIAGLQRLGIG